LEAILIRVSGHPWWGNFEDLGIQSGFDKKTIEREPNRAIYLRFYCCLPSLYFIEIEKVIQVSKEQLAHYS
jgi:hypothetical protein